MKISLKSKSFAIIILLLLTIAGFILGAQAWANYTLVPGEAAFGWLQVTGNQGVSSLLPVMVALAAIAVSLMIATALPRIVLGLLTALLGGWVAYSAWQVSAADEAALVAFANKQIAEITGFADAHEANIVSSATLTIMPLMTAILGVLIVVLGVIIVLFSRQWSVGGRKYEVQKPQAGAASKSDSISDWDSLSSGEDPSDDQNTP